MTEHWNSRHNAPTVMFVKYNSGNVGSLRRKNVIVHERRCVLASGYGLIGDIVFPKLALYSIKEVSLCVHPSFPVLLTHDRFYRRGHSGQVSSRTLSSHFECDAQSAAMLLRGRCPFFTSEAIAIDPFTREFPAETLIAIATVGQAVEVSS